MIELWAGAVRWTFCIYFAPIDLSRGGDSLGGDRKETFQYFCDGRGYSCIVASGGQGFARTEGVRHQETWKFAFSA